MQRDRTLVFTCWVPVASLVGVELYARGYDGWGAWSTAPLFLIPLALGLVIAGYGAVRCFTESRTGALRASTVAATLVAALPLFWILVRRHVL